MQPSVRFILRQLETIRRAMRQLTQKIRLMVYKGRRTIATAAVAEMPKTTTATNLRHPCAKNSLALAAKEHKPRRVVAH